MPIPIHTPRVNNNDDTVRLSAVLVQIGSRVRAGDPIIDVETDKATFTVETTVDGFLLGVNGAQGDTLDVGSVLAWIGATADEAWTPREAVSDASPTASEPTLKALFLLREYGIRASEVPFSGPRLTARDVEAHARSRKLGQPQGPPGHLDPFTPEERGMLRTVSWHREEACAGYVELPYDPGPWESYAADFQKRQGLLLSPLLSLMCWRLSRLAAENPRINATAFPEGRFLYDQVNMAFTVQAGPSLYLVVVRDAAAKAEAEFVHELGDLQRGAMKHALRPEQTSDATIAFSSMARWKVSRHVPILAPRTALIVAHTAAHLGATYDHRILTGFDAVLVLQALAAPPV